MMKIAYCLICGAFWAWLWGDVASGVDAVFYTYGCVSAGEDFAAWIARKLGWVKQ